VNLFGFKKDFVKKRPMV